MPRPLVEICVETIDGCAAARAGGADRIELGSALGEGGVTPSLGVLVEARRSIDLPIVVLLRPRRGDFLYTAAELAVMARDLGLAKEAGADGVALGVLANDGSIDRERTARLVELARPMQVTFHRAFDLTRDADEALEVLIELGVDRVLTSGQEQNVVAGMERIAELASRAGERIVIMPGGGVRPSNVSALARATGVREVHLSAGGERDSAMGFRRPELCLGPDGAPGEYRARVTDVEQVRSVVEALESLADRA